MHVCMGQFNVHKQESSSCMHVYIVCEASNAVVIVCGADSA